MSDNTEKIDVYIEKKQQKRLTNGNKIQRERERQHYLTTLISTHCNFQPT